MGVPKSFKFSYFDHCGKWLWNPYFFPWKHHEKILCPDEFPQMLFKLADDLKLDRGNDRSFDIYYHSFRMGTCLKHFINTYHCVCWMKSTSIDRLDVPYVRPWSLHASDQDFPNRGGGIPPQWQGIKNFVINLMVETWGEVILTIQTFFNTKNNIL